MTEFDKTQFKEALQNIGKARDQIVSLYSNSLYEDDWQESTIQEFEDQLDIYNTNLAIVKDMLPSVKWDSPETKKQFMNTYYNVVKDDNEVFNLAKIRHDAYLVYRTNRKSLIKQLNTVAGLVKAKGDKDYVEIFNYFNDVCAKVPFYTNKDKAGNITISQDPHLHNWFYRHINDVVSELYDSTSIEGTYSGEEYAKVFNKYEYCRKMIFKIFNMITSTSKLNGYEKWHNILDTFCQAELKDVQMERLYNAAGAEDDFLPGDDHWQIMDDRTWNAKGIYESYNSYDDSYKSDFLNDDFDDNDIDSKVVSLNYQQQLLSDQLYNLCYDEYFYEAIATYAGTRSGLADGYCYEVAYYVLENLIDSNKDIDNIHCYFVENKKGDSHYYFECNNIFFDGYNYTGVSKVTKLKFFKTYFKEWLPWQIVEAAKDVTEDIKATINSDINESKSLNESWWIDELDYYNKSSRKPIKTDIVKIDMQDPAANVCKVITNGKSMFAGTTFYPNDIIEICPTRTIEKSALYSKDMRDIVFEIVPNKEWVLPFGYCQYYDIQTDSMPANCDFVWDPVARVIVIKAINKIKKHEKLVLNNKK